MKAILGHLTIGKRLALGFSVLILISLGMTVFSLLQLKKINAISQEIKDVTLPGLRMTMQLNISINDFRANEVSHILSKDDKDMKKRDEQLEETKKLIETTRSELEKLLIDKDDKKFLEEFKINWTDYTAGTVDILKNSKEKKVTEALGIWNDAISMSIFEVTREQLVKLKDQKVKEASTKVLLGEQMYQNALKLMISGAIILVISSMIMAFLIIRNVKSNLNKAVYGVQEGTSTLADLSMKLQTSSENLSESSQSQAAMVQESASTVEEVSAMVTKTAENAAQSINLVNRSNQEAKNGKKAVDEMVESINEISKSNEDILSKIEENNTRLDSIIAIIAEIESKTKVINDIVFQTKLLSFNASVEAARAGEHGKGFAVVAEEVANLAQMSGKASHEISDMLDKSISQVKLFVSETKNEINKLSKISKDKVDEGLDRVKNCEAALENILINVNEVTIMVNEIASASGEQATGVQEMNKAISQIDVSTQKNATMAKETSNVVEELNTQVMNLNTVIEELKTEVG